MVPRILRSYLEAHKLGGNGFHDFVGSCEDGHYPHVPPCTCNRVFLAVAVPSVELEASIDYSLGHVCDPELCHGDVEDHVPPFHVLHEELVQECATQFHLRRHFYDPELSVLELGDGFSEGAPFLAIRDGHFQNPFREGLRTDRAHESLLLQLLHKHPET